MKFDIIEAPGQLAIFVKNIWVIENEENPAKSVLPFFADGFPGLMFQNTDNRLTIFPHKKLMPNLFVYGQTIHPIEIEITGNYQIINFQLYPFVLKSLFGIEPGSINDYCHELKNLSSIDIVSLTHQLFSQQSVPERIECLSEILLQTFKARKYHFDQTIKKAIGTIISTNGLVSITELIKQLNINRRTFERNFAKETGLSPKQFIMIIQFNASLSQIKLKDYNKLTDVVYDNGYSDQSHFIRVFKAYTGNTPKNFTKK